MTDPLREALEECERWFDDNYRGTPLHEMVLAALAAPPSEEADKLAWFSASANAALATPPSGLDRPLRARIDAWKRDGAPNEKSLAAFGLALIDATPPSEEATECEGCYHDPHVALCPGPTADGSACPCDTLTNVSPLRETETDAHHVHVGEHCLTCVRHGVALALATPPWTSAAGVLRGKVWPAGQWCTCETHHATGCTAASDGGREHATPLSEEATDVRYHDPSVCGFSSAHISTDPKVHTTAEERLSPPSEEAMSITSHVTVGQCSCAEHHGATPPFEEATDLVLVRKDSGGVFPDGTTNTPAIDYSTTPEATPPPEEATRLREALNELEELAAELVQDHRGIPYDVIDAIDGIVAKGRARLTASEEATLMLHTEHVAGCVICGQVFETTTPPSKEATGLPPANPDLIGTHDGPLRATGRPGREQEAYDAGRLAGYEDGLEVGERVLKAVRALTYPYTPGTASPSYENGWYDGRGAAVRAIQDLTASDGGRE